MDNQPRPGSNINNASFTSYAQPLFADAKKSVYLINKYYSYKVQYYMCTK